jgi:hypothetical protein
MGNIRHRALVRVPTRLTPVHIPTHSCKGHIEPQIAERILRAASAAESTTYVDINAHLRGHDDRSHYARQILSDLMHFYAINTIMHRLTQTWTYSI